MEGNKRFAFEIFSRLSSKHVEQDMPHWNPADIPMHCRFPRKCVLRAAAVMPGRTLVESGATAGGVPEAILREMTTHTRCKLYHALM